MIRRPQKSTRPDTLFPTLRSSELCLECLAQTHLVGEQDARQLAPPCFGQPGKRIAWVRFWLGCQALRKSRHLKWLWRGRRPRQTRIIELLKILTDLQKEDLDRFTFMLRWRLVSCLCCDLAL